MLQTLSRSLFKRPGVNSRLVHPAFRNLARALIRDLRANGYVVSLNSAYRSLAHQADLHRRWEEEDPGIIAEPAPPGESAHNYGLALDLQLDPPDYDTLADLADAYGLGWGGDDDPVHVEHPDWPTLSRRFNETMLVTL